MPCTGLFVQGISYCREIDWQLLPVLLGKFFCISPLVGFPWQEILQPTRNSSAAHIVSRKGHQSTKDPEPANEWAPSALTIKMESRSSSKAILNVNSLGHDRPHNKSPRNPIEKPKNSEPPTRDRIRGRKRDAQGNFNERSGHDSKKPKIGGNGYNSNNKDEQNDLLQEILALGGSWEDLSLVMGVGSDEDDEETNTKHKQLAIDSEFRKDLSIFIAGLGIEMQADIDSGEAELDEDEDGESGDIPNLFIPKPKPTNNIKEVETAPLQDVKGSAKRQKDLVSTSLYLSKRYSTNISK